MIVGLVLAASPVRAQLLAEQTSVVGDSISRGFDADTDLCRYMDEPEHGFATGVDHGSFCGPGGDGTFSHAERLECAKGESVMHFNDAMSGADIKDFEEQASRIRGRFADQPGPHYVPVLLGHNDACTDTTNKTGNACSGDRDPDNYCRTTPAAFEREFRRGLDELIQIPSARVLVLALLRISQLCNFQDKDACGALPGVKCDVLWRSSELLADVFGPGGICASLTVDCSNQRRIDMYETLLGYNDILQRVTDEYAALASGATSPTGARKADDVAVRYLEAPFYYRFRENELSCCDCFHPSELGQRKLAEASWNGLTCSAETPCCAASDDFMVEARCGGTLDTTTSYPGGFWANDVICGNGVVDPDEACDDGNLAPGDGCSEVCTTEDGTPSPTSATPEMTTTPGTPVATATPPVGGSCAGDCDADQAVTVNELVLAVNIALEDQPIASCAAADTDADGRVTIAELLVAVNHLLSGCESAVGAR